MSASRFGRIYPRYSQGEATARKIRIITTRGRW